MPHALTPAAFAPTLGELSSRIRGLRSCRRRCRAACAATGQPNMIASIHSRYTHSSPPHFVRRARHLQKPKILFLRTRDPGRLCGTLTKCSPRKRITRLLQEKRACALWRSVNEDVQLPHEGPASSGRWAADCGRNYDVLL